MTDRETVNSILSSGDFDCEGILCDECILGRCAKSIGMNCLVFDMENFCKEWLIANPEDGTK